MSGEVLVWNGRAADPAPSEREALVGLEEVAVQAEPKGAEPAPQGGQLVASEDEPSRGGSASGLERM